MTKPLQSSRKYTFSDAKLKKTADNLLSLIDRDMALFSVHNFSPAQRAEFANMITEFDAVMPDEIMEGKKMTKTELKVAARNILIRKLKTAALMCKHIFGQYSNKYNSFGDTDYSKQNDEALYKNAKAAIRFSTIFLDNLAEEGMTVQRIQEMETANSNFNAAVNEQAKAEMRRELATSERVEIGNKLYQLIIKYSNTGKDIWYAENEAYYNDYLVYSPTNKTKKASKEKPKAKD
jgi:hypothetical protein